MATRIPLTDGSGRYFYPEKCRRYEEGRWFDGRNMISYATGSQWHHEALYVTPRGKFILHAWSDYAGTRDSYQQITLEAAASWFARNYLEPPADIMEVFESLEIE